jgi:hypothetical protein
MSVSRSGALLSTGATHPAAVRAVAADSGIGAVVAVLSRSRPGEWLRSWPDDAPEPMVVDLSGDSGSSLRLPAGDDRVVAGLGGTDLTGVSMVVNSLVDRHGPTVVYVESLSGFSICAGSDRTARFARVVVDTVTDAGGTVVADVDPTAHTDPDLRRLADPFDRVVSPRTPAPGGPQA